MKKIIDKPQDRIPEHEYYDILGCIFCFSIEYKDWINWPPLFHHIKYENIESGYVESNKYPLQLLDEYFKKYEKYFHLYKLQNIPKKNHILKDLYFDEF